MKRRRSWLAQRFRRLYRDKLTPPGRVAVVLVLLSAAGLLTDEIPVYLVFCGATSLFGIAELFGTAMRPRVQLSGEFPERILVGQTATARVSVKNLGRWPAWDLMCRVLRLPKALRHLDPHVMIPRLAPGEQQVLPVSIKAGQRGEYVLPDLWVHSTFPFNLMRFGGDDLEVRKLTVLPTFHRLEQLEIPIVQRYQAGGTIHQSRTGEAMEFSGNREYVPGEPVRRMDFRAWARLGRPVVREYQGEFASRVALCLDTFVARSWGRRDPVGANDFEAAISLTAAIIDSLDNRQTSLDLFAAGPDLFLFQSPEGGSHLEAVMEILAAVASTHRNPFEDLGPALDENLESTSVTICVLLDWDAAREEMLRRVLDSGCEARVYIVRNRPTTLPLPEQAGFTLLDPAAIQAGEVLAL